MLQINIEEFATTTEAAKMLDLEPSSIKVYCRKGIIAAMKIGHSWMIPLSEIRRYSRERKRPGRPTND